MKPRYRRVFFLGALFLFTIVAPVLILGASGYRYDFQGQALVPTGTLVLKSYPEGARIRINQREGTDRTPAEIQGLLPSRYVLEVNSEDFRPWRKEVEIQANRITVEDQILLIPKRIAFSSVSAKEIRTFAVSPDGRKLIYVHRKSAEEAESLWFDWESLPGVDTETRLSILTRWVCDARDAHLRWGLRLPGIEFMPDSGSGHAVRCLEALALYGLAPATAAARAAKSDRSL